LPATLPSTLIPSAAGRRYRLETTTEAPKPKPVYLGSWAMSGNTMNEQYMPAPSRNAARFVVHTPRIRIIVMSISGWRLRTSTSTHRPQTAIPAASSPSVFGEPQPQTVVCAIATSTMQSPRLISAAATQLTVPGARIGDSGM
jgi:hypothetical protein